MCMKCHDIREPLYLEADALRVGLGTGLLQMWDNLNCGCDEAPDNTMFWLITFPSKSLSSMEQQYSNIEREVLAILHELEKFHHYCFAHEKYVI